LHNRRKAILKATFPHFGDSSAGLPKAFYAKKDARADNFLAIAQVLIF
jgi:hypothetical protein